MPRAGDRASLPVPAARAQPMNFGSRDRRNRASPPAKPAAIGMTWRSIRNTSTATSTMLQRIDRQDGRAARRGLRGIRLHDLQQ